MKNFIAPRSLSLPKGRLITIFLLAAFFALSACDDSSSAGDDDNNVILSSDSREESSDSRSNDKDEAISSSGKTESNRSSSSAKETKDSSDTKSSSSVKSGNSSNSHKGDSSSSVGSSSSEKQSSSAMSKVESSSSEEMKNAWDYLNPGIDYGEFTDERDGQVYKTVKIGGQVWMAENLNYAYTGVPYNFSYNNDVYTSDSTSWCYDNDPANCAKYGRLYTWAAAMDSVGSNRCGYGKTCRVASASSATLVRGICPKGWHLPSNDEWKALIVAVDGSITEYTSSNTAGSKLKSVTGWYDDGNGEDTFGFSALPAGIRDGRGSYYYYEGDFASFWSSTENYSNPAYKVTLFYDKDGASLISDNKADGHSVRCVKDSE